MQKAIILITMVLSLQACVKPNQDEGLMFNQQQATKVIVKEKTMALPEGKVKASFAYGNDAKVIKAYHRYLKTGRAPNVMGDGFKTLAYSAHSHPIIDCAPLRLCVLQLAEGERINHIALGDSAHWLVATALIGSKDKGSYQITIKPKLYDIATDMVVTTNERTYNVGLVSHKDANTHVVNFYYPEATLQQAIASAKILASHEAATVSHASRLAVNKLNFDYDIQRKHANWQPVRVFDDGEKTFIQMPASIKHRPLPVLYLASNKQMRLVNYRYRAPYYIVDGVFDKAYLITGHGREQSRVTIINRHWG